VKLNAFPIYPGIAGVIQKLSAAVTGNTRKVSACPFESVTVAEAVTGIKIHGSIIGVVWVVIAFGSLPAINDSRAS
jgi:hypothetical protein